MVPLNSQVQTSQTSFNCKKKNSQTFLHTTHYCRSSSRHWPATTTSRREWRCWPQTKGWLIFIIKKPHVPPPLLPPPPSSPSLPPPSSLQPGLRILEALAASGLRSIRYAQEIPQLDSVVANDFSKDAYASICDNVQYNSVGGKVIPSWREATYVYLCVSAAIIWILIL